MELRDKNTQKIVLSNLLEARGFYSRLKGLLGRSSLPQGEGLLFRKCNSIHTLGMGFPIDCVFLDKTFTIKKIHKTVKPGRFVLPVWGANSVVEMNAGIAEKLNLKTGDVLYVVN